MSQLRPALVCIAALTLITGLAYPLAITGAGRLLFPSQARGSLILRKGQVVGSELIAQHTEDPRFFWGRLSATSDYPTNAANSGGSNLAPTAKALVDRVQADVAALKAGGGPVPADLVTTSASGLDPDISPAAALLQVRRVAAARGLPEVQVRALVEQSTQDRTLGVLGEPHVNVLALNLALDALQ